MVSQRVYRVLEVKSKIKKRFYSMGIMPDAAFSIVMTQPFGGPVIIEIQGRRIALRKEEFECLKIS